MLYFCMFFGNPSCFSRPIPGYFAAVIAPGSILPILSSFSARQARTDGPCTSTVRSCAVQLWTIDFRLSTIFFVTYRKMNTYEFGVANYIGINTSKTQDLKLFRISSYEKRREYCSAWLCF